MLLAATLRVRVLAVSQSVLRQPCHQRQIVSVLPMVLLTVLHKSRMTCVTAM